MIFGPLQALREKPIPSPAAGEKRNYRAVPIDFDSAANREPLVDCSARGLAGRAFYATPRNPPYYFVVPGAIEALLLRESACARLVAVNARLAPAELELFIFDGWRSQAVQAFFHDRWLPDRLRTARPDLSGAALQDEVERYWAAPSTGPSGPSPHSTGGAVDLTIRWRDGESLWMGTIFDDPTPASHSAALEAAPNDPHALDFTHEEGRANRRLLYWLMRDAGFAANPTEWWHFSYGDQMWAQLTGAPGALYGGVEGPA